MYCGTAFGVARSMLARPEPLPKKLMKTFVEPTSSDLSWSSTRPLIDSPVQFATMAPGVGVSAMTTVEASAVSEPNVARTVAEPAPVPKKSPAAEMLPAPETTLQVTSPPSTRPSRHVAVAENLVGAGLLRYTVSGPDAAIDTT